MFDVFGRRESARSYAFEVLGQPSPKGRPRFVRKTGHAFTPKKTREAEKTLRDKVKEKAPRQPLSGPLRLCVLFVMRIPPSWPKWKREAAQAGRLHHTSKPDVDNLVKLTKDSLNGVLWVDDSQVASVKATKVYGDRPCTVIQIEEFAQATKESEKAQKEDEDGPGED